jgi:glycosyltransferase involved in cell wall biosynthesis
MIKDMVSIIMPIHNTVQYIERAIESLICQSYASIEIILIDDGSTDGSGCVCDKFALKYSKTKVFHQENRGVSAARNLGIKQAQGEYLMFVDSDDELPTDSVHNLISVARHEDCALVIGAYLVIENTSTRLVSANRDGYTNSDLACSIISDFDGITAFVMSSACGKLFKTQLIHNNRITFDEELVNGEDGLFVAEYVFFTRKIRNIFLPTYIIHRYDPKERVSAILNVYPDFFEFHVRYHRKLWEIFGNDADFQKQQDCLQAFFDKLIVHLIRAGAYSNFFAKGELNMKIKQLFELAFVKKASLAYRRKRVVDSIFIPFFFMFGQSCLLCTAIKIKGIHYIKAKGKSEFVKSIYRNHQ